MNSRMTKKYKDLRKEFKKDIYEIAKNNSAFAMLIIETYVASQHRKHIMQVWALLGFNHKEAYKDYCDKLMGKHLTGRDEIFRSIYFVDKEIYNKYIYKIPECYAMGDALAVAYKVLKEKK